MRILYVDDDRLNALLFSEACGLITDIEVEVETVASGAHALEVVADWRPDLLVLDLHLPDGRGTDLLPRLRAALSAPRLPALLCTAESPSAVSAAAAAAGFDGCLAKPLAMQHLLDEIKRLGSSVGKPWTAAP